MAAQQAPGPDPTPTFACFRPDQRRDGLTGSGHGLWLVNAAPALPRLLADDPARVLASSQQAAARQALAAAPPLGCRGLQRVDWQDADGRLGSLAFAIGLDRHDRRALLAAYGEDGPAKAAPGRLAARKATPTPVGPGQVLVIGAGLAGAFTAAALTRRGRRVVIAERGAAPGGAVTDVPLLAQHPALSADDNVRSRLSRAALLLAWRLRELTGPALQWCGRHQRVDGSASAQLAGWPAELARPDPTAADGESVLFFERCALARRAPLFDTLLQGPGIDLRLGHAVSGLHRDEAGWWARGEHPSSPLGPFAAVIVACPEHAPLTGLGPPWLPQGHFEPGQVMIASAASPLIAELPARIMGGYRAAGAPFELDWGPWRVIGVQDGSVEAPEHRDDGEERDKVTGAADGWSWRRSEPALRLDPIDHLPLIGAVPDQAAIIGEATAFARNDRLPYPVLPGLFLATGLGGRGLLWAQLAGEVLAAAIEDEPPLLESSLQAALDPARFMRRRLRRSQHAGSAAGRPQGV